MRKILILIFLLNTTILFAARFKANEKPDNHKIVQALKHDLDNSDIECKVIEDNFKVFLSEEAPSSIRAANLPEVILESIKHAFNGGFDPEKIIEVPSSPGNKANSKVNSYIIQYYYSQIEDSPTSKYRITYEVMLSSDETHITEIKVEFNLITKEIKIFTGTIPKPTIKIIREYDLRLLANCNITPK